jgi:hypothetical protein
LIVGMEPPQRWQTTSTTRKPVKVREVALVSLAVLIYFNLSG